MISKNLSWIIPSSTASGSGMNVLSVSSLPRVCPPPRKAVEVLDGSRGGGPALKRLNRKIACKIIRTVQLAEESL